MWLAKCAMAVPFVTRETYRVEVCPGHAKVSSNGLDELGAGTRCQMICMLYSYSHTDNGPGRLTPFTTACCPKRPTSR